MELATFDKTTDPEVVFDRVEKYVRLCVPALGHHGLARGCGFAACLRVFFLSRPTRSLPSWRSVPLLPMWACDV